MASKKTEEKTKVVEEQAVEKVKTEKEVKVKKSKAEIVRALKRDASKIDVEVMNLTNGSFIYENGYDSIRMNEPGETAIIGLDLLLKMKNSPCIKKLFISIVDVYNEEYELEDILDMLDLTKMYNSRILTLDCLDEMLEKTSIDEFSEIMNKESFELINRLCQRAVYLSSLNKFDSMGKRSIVENKFGNDYMFKSN